jgi:microcystin-dependent protein
MDVNAGNADLSNALNQLEVGSLILLQDKASPTTKWKQFKTTGVPTDNSSWHSIPVAIKTAGADLTAGRVTVDINNVPIPTSTPALPAPDYPGPPNTGADSATDLNTITAAGWYRKMVGPTNPNIPLSGTYWYIQTLVYAGAAYVTQYAYPYSTQYQLGLMHRVCTNGTWSPWQGEIPPGQIGYFAMSAAPQGWLKANGALVSRTAYAALFANIGAVWGAGDGSTTFALPDLRGDFIRSWSDGHTTDSGRAFGTLQLDGVLSHTHTWTAGTIGANSVDHTHAATGLTMGAESVDHSHTVAVAGTTAGVSANHTHTFADNASTTGTGSANHTHSYGTYQGSGAGCAGGAQNPFTQQTTGASGAAHTHTVAASGTTGGNSVGHTHTFADNSSATGGRSAGHTHAMSGATAGQSVGHTHTVAGTNAVQAGGLTETRPRNIALLACIKF